MKPVYLDYNATTPVHPLVAKAIKPSTVLLTIMHANNETGTIQPIEKISRVTRRRGILFHTDAAQSLGKIPVNVRRLGVSRRLQVAVGGIKRHGFDAR